MVMKLSEGAVRFPEEDGETAGPEAEKEPSRQTAGRFFYVEVYGQYILGKQANGI